MYFIIVTNCITFLTHIGVFLALIMMWVMGIIKYHSSSFIKTILRNVEQLKFAIQSGFLI